MLLIVENIVKSIGFEQEDVASRVIAYNKLK